MKKEYLPAIHFVAFIFSSVIYIFLVDRFVSEDSLLLSAAGLLSLVAGIWGNIAGFVLLNIPYGPRSYKVINYILVVIGAIALVAGLHKHFQI